MAAEIGKTGSIVAVLRKYNEARGPWQAYVVETGKCYCGIELVEPIGKWSAEHSDCSVNLAPEWTTNDDLNADKHDGTPLVPVGPLKRTTDDPLEMLRIIVADARDEGRADMRDSVDEMYIEHARQILALPKPKCGGCGGSGRVSAFSELTGEPGSRVCGACRGNG